MIHLIRKELWRTMEGNGTGGGEECAFRFEIVKHNRAKDHTGNGYGDGTVVRYGEGDGSGLIAKFGCEQSSNIQTLAILAINLSIHQDLCSR